MRSQTTIIVGAGIFGMTAALAFKQRGHNVHLLDPGPLPYPLAESTDISKAICMDYGPDEDYKSNRIWHLNSYPYTISFVFQRLIKMERPILAMRPSLPCTGAAATNMTSLDARLICQPICFGSARAHRWS